MMAPPLIRQAPALKCVGGPSAGQIVADPGTDIVNVVLGWNEMAWDGSASGFASYRRCTLQFPDGDLVMLVPDTLDSLRAVLTELIRGYRVG